MQNQCNYIIKDNDNVKFLLAYIKKMQNTTKVERLAINKTASLTKIVVGKKKLDINNKKI